METYFKNKVVWITGASSGIGEALAMQVNAYGAFVVLSARKELPLHESQRKLQHPEQSQIVLMDVANQASIDACAAQVLDRHGRIDILVNNAGLSQRSNIIETPMSVYRYLMEVNYFGTIALTKAVLPAMIRQQAGQIIVISSVAGKIGAPFRSGYSASKHALHGFFDCLRLEHEQDHLKVNIICPGWTKTKIAQNALNKAGEANKAVDPEIEGGMDPNELAKKILKSASQNIPESYFGGKEVLTIYLKRFFPQLLQKILRRKYLNK